jgi:hypothetical protein
LLIEIQKSKARRRCHNSTNLAGYSHNILLLLLLAVVSLGYKTGWQTQKTKNKKQPETTPTNRQQPTPTGSQCSVYNK